jgi:hypothetical protein
MRFGGRRKALPDDTLELRDLEFAQRVHPLSDQQKQKRKEEARKIGSRDGKKGFPGRDHAEVPQVNAYIDEAEDVIGTISYDWHDRNKVLLGEWCRRLPLIAALESQVAALSSRVAQADKRVEAKRVLHEKELAKARSAKPGTRSLIGRVPYIIGLAAVFAVDVPLNAVVFQIFGESEVVTWALAVLLGILVVPGAHLLGMQIRGGFPDRFITAATIVLPFGLIIAVATLRTIYVGSEDAGLSGALGFLVFFLFNLAVFGSAIFLSYLRHDPYEQQIEAAAAELKKAAKQLEGEREAFAEAQMALGRLQADAAQIRAWGEEELHRSRNLAHSYRNHFESLVGQYVGGNQAERPTEVIRALEEAGRWKATLPPDLEGDLDWSCTDAVTRTPAAAITEAQP